MEWLWYNDWRLKLKKKKYKKCEQLMYDAIKKLEDSKRMFNKAKECLQNGESEVASLLFRHADHAFGQGAAIESVLTAIGFKHDDMKKLLELLQIVYFMEG